MEITIDGKIVELGDSIPAITKKSIDINNPSIRFVDFTNRFILPDTINNRKILKSPETIGSNNKSFARLYDVVINDVFKIFKGQGFLDSRTSDKNNFQVIDESKEILNVLDVQLNTIKWDDKDTFLTTSEIDALDSVDPTNCWFWGKACYHEKPVITNTDQTTGNARCKYSRPAFYVQGLLNRAIELQGYTFTFPLPDLAFSSNQNDFLFTAYQKTLSQTINIAGTYQLTGLNANNFIIDFAATDTTIVCDDIKHRWRLRGNISVNANLKFRIKLSSPIEDDEIIDFYINQNDIYIDISSGDFMRQHPNAKIEFYLIGTGTIIFNDTLLYTLHSESNEDLNLSTNPFLSYKIKVHDNLPELTYIDLFKLICVIGNKYHIVDTLNKTFEFETLANLNKNNSADWSEKFVINSESIKGQFPGLFQKNYLKYENDLTVSKELGSSYFETDNKSLSKEGDYIVLKFGASNEIKINNIDIAHVNIYEDIKRIPDQKINMRLFAIESDKLKFNPLNWTNIVQNYYSNWFNSLFRIRQIDCLMNINKLDFLKWHPKQLIYIDYFKTVFIVLEISNFIPGRLTKVKLLSYGR